MKKLLIVLFCVFVLTFGLSSGEKKVDKSKHTYVVKTFQKSEHQPIVKELITILKTRPDLKDALKVSLRKANRLEAPTLEAYYKFLDDMVTLIPTDRNLYQHIVEFYYLIDHPDDGLLQTDELFIQWTVKFANDWGSFLDTPASAKGIQTFLMDPTYHMGDYIEGPSGWYTFNQFFARQLKGGKRPVDHLCDDNFIVSPADSTFRMWAEVNDESEIIVKGIKYKITDLLQDSPYQECFKGGIFMHSFLNVNDYHRYHTPVSGKVLDARVIAGRVFLEVVKNLDGSLSAEDSTGYQFTQARGLIVLESQIGLVAVLPIGMAQVSSCNISVDVGDVLSKGEEFGYFLFGGSDIIIVFEKKCNVKICAQPFVHYNVGKTIAVTEGTPCPPPPGKELDCELSPEEVEKKKDEEIKKEEGKRRIKKK